jgi:nucleotide-binding universal stress UspA family protein
MGLWSLGVVGERADGGSAHRFMEAVMTELNPTPIVVGVGHDPIEAALTAAADEAVRVGCGVHNVYVVHLLTQGSEAGLVTETDPERTGRLALNAALEQARDVAPAAVPVTCELLAGGVVPTLVDAAAGARMVVIQHRDLSRMRRLVSRSVASGPAAHTRVPVVAVPSGWSPPTPREPPVRDGRSRHAGPLPARLAGGCR